MPGWLRFARQQIAQCHQAKAATGGAEESLRELVDIGKFIGVEQRVAKGEEAFGLDGLERGLGFNWGRRAD